MAFKVIDNVEEYLSPRSQKNSNKYQPKQKMYDSFMESQGSSIEDSPESKFKEEQNQGDETYLGKAARVGLGALSSGISGLAGVPRNILDTANSLINLTRPEMSEEVRQSLKSHPELESFATGNVIPTGLTPSSQQVKETIGKALPEGYLNPQGESEESIHEFANDIGALMFPLTGATKIGKAAKIAGVPNLAKFLTKKLGGSEELQEGVKLGTTLLSAFGMQDSLKTRAKKMYDKIEEIVPETASISTKPIRDVMDKAAKFSGRGNINVASKKAVNEVLTALDDISSGNRIGIKDLIAFKQDMNESLTNAFKNHPRAGKYLSEITQGINNALKNNPEIPKNVGKLLTDADNIWIGVNAGNKASEFIKRYSDKLSKYSALTGLFSPITAIKGIGAGAVGALTSPASAGLIGFTKNLASNPTVRNEYAKMIGGALKDSGPIFLKHAHKLNDTLEKTQPSEYESAGSNFKVIDNVDEYLNRKARSKRN